MINIANAVLYVTVVMAVEFVTIIIGMMWMFSRDYDIWVVMCMVLAMRVVIMTLALYLGIYHIDQYVLST